MAEPTKIRANMDGDIAVIKALFNHVEETGQRHDAAGKLIPAHFIKDVTVTINGTTVMTANWGTGISKNPLIGFRVKGFKSGDKVSISWTDNTGDSRTDEATIN
jgi:sulfur-oxidizing protein SoxZ